ncbi:MAG: hypothetical protein ACO3JL_18090 [Myxococcota bacterium]
MSDWSEDDGDARSGRRAFHEFECPKCDANNPSEGFSFGDEIFCFYCGATFKAMERDGRLRLKET